MSGGSKDYTYCKVDEYFCGQMHDKELDDMMDDIVSLMKELEWFESGDTPEADYFKEVKRFKDKWFKTTRTERLKGYIDGSIDKTKQDLYRLLGVDDGGEIK